MSNPPPRAGHWTKVKLEVPPKLAETSWPPSTLSGNPAMRLSNMATVIALLTSAFGVCQASADDYEVTGIFDQACQSGAKCDGDLLSRPPFASRRAEPSPPTCARRC